MGGNAVKGLSDRKINIPDTITVFVLVAFFSLFATLSLNGGCYWGDDYAAYISEGIAIADGDLAAQSAINSIMHPSPLPDEAVGKPLVYVWGYPLALSLIYSVFGFDRVGFSTILLYKLPTVIAFALFSAVLFLLMRRRFRYMLSLLLTAAFCSCAEFYSFFNTLYSDIYFMFFALLSLYVTEVYLEKNESPGHELFGVLLGIILWYMYEIRLNGIAILLSCIVAHIIYVLKEKKFSHFEALLRELIPYIVFFALKMFSESLLAAPTSNISDYKDISFSLFLSNLGTYFALIRDFFFQIWNNLLINPLYSVLRRLCDISFSDLRIISSVLVWLSIALTVSGIVFCGIKKNLHLTLLLIFYIIAASMLPYTQGMRYIYPILPVILLFFGYGTKYFSDKFRLSDRKAVSRTAIIVVSLMCVLCAYQVVSNAMERNYAIPEKTEIVNIEDIYMQNAYSPCAVEVYNYIRENTPEDCTLAFFAPRGLYLNTGRFSIKPDVNGHSIDEADYYLDYLSTGEYNISPDLGDDFECIFKNIEFILYKRIEK